MTTDTNSVRRLDKNHDWTFGQGMNNYATESESIKQRVQTRLWSFTNDWFLDLEHGVPWLELMGRNVDWSKLEKEVKNCVLRTDGVASIVDYSTDLDVDTRKLIIQIEYQDIYYQTNTVTYQGEV
ncbi:hypothetical protein FW755_11140 [Lonepinella koalarum]|uniref:Phage baseplate assembly protein W n=1 Tax=Lonepinella koalarum TaxID=53417 RepID=A0A4R1KSR3_9PAST|nr:hypothetical protein [Lonepinella koalarum]MDH2927215.1 hypothetical protein [Lonepinella koalarum]TCK68115.1 hypothetical protein EV692_1814 [Lonepinella koalarum]TFJ89485.1 hypothetical protein E0709_08915 [Lonepinella koalarum]TYG33479.1 hypothetical protein FW755_11140 [Lonepinella koalarum]